MPLDSAGLRAKLSELGGKPIAGFNQAAAIEAAGATSGGACVGICVDWLRRIVQCREKQAYPNDPDKTRRALDAHSALEKGAVAAEQARYDKAKAGVIAWPEKRKEQLRTEKSQLEANRGQKQRRYDIVYAAYASSTDSAQRGTLYAEVKQLEADLDALAARDKAIATEYVGVQDKAQAVLSRADADRAAKSPVHRVWDDAVTILDTASKNKRKYGGLSVVISVPMGNFRTAGHLVFEAIQSREFSAERGALFDVAPGATGVGHTVAGFHQANSRYLLFDPNLGVYEFDAGPFIKAVATLFIDGYANCVDSTGGVRASYTIFGDTAQAPTVRPPMSAAAAAAGGGSG
jgi:hypothetical protein